MGNGFAGTAVGCGVAGLPLLLMSYAWVPFAWAGREPGFVLPAVVVGEVGAVAAGALAVGLGVAARWRYGPGHPARGRASRALALGAAVLVLVLVPNLIAHLLAAQ